MMDAQNAKVVIAQSVSGEANIVWRACRVTGCLLMSVTNAMIPIAVTIRLMGRSVERVNKGISLMLVIVLNVLILIAPFAPSIRKFVKHVFMGTKWFSENVKGFFSLMNDLNGFIKDF